MTAPAGRCDVCLLAYGQTGAGKTHTMAGGPGEGEEGVAPRAIRGVVAGVEELRRAGWECSVEVREGVWVASLTWRRRAGVNLYVAGGSAAWRRGRR